MSLADYIRRPGVNPMIWAELYNANALTFRLTGDKDGERQAVVGVADLERQALMNLSFEALGTLNIIMKAKFMLRLEGWFMAKLFGEGPKIF